MLEDHEGPPTEGSSRKVILLEVTAVARDVWSRSLLRICFLGRVDPKRWLVESSVVLVAKEALPVGSKPPAAVGERIPEDGGHDLGAAAPLSTRAFSPEQGGVGGPVQSSPKLVEHIGSGSTRVAEQLSPCIA